eukprot:COSAG01_NODE_1014_length_12131_cov_10.088749_8_plen_213_part_00
MCVCVCVQAKRLIFTGERIDGQAAAAIGLVDEVIGGDSTGAAGEGVDTPAFQRAMQLATTICGRAPIALKMAKQAIDRGSEVDLSTGLAFERVRIEPPARPPTRHRGRACQLIIATWASFSVHDSVLQGLDDMVPPPPRHATHRRSPHRTDWRDSQPLPRNVRLCIRVSERVSGERVARGERRPIGTRSDRPVHPPPAARMIEAAANTRSIH